MPIFEVSSEYRAYLNSEEWQKIREEVLRRDNYQCQVCGSMEDLQVHHTRSIGRFNERKHPETVVTLCNTCHERIHLYFKVCDALKAHYDRKRRELGLL